MRRVWVVAFVVLVGFGLGLAVGWLWWPVEYYDTEIADLEKAHQAEYVWMVSDAYALTGNLDAARERLARLGAPDVAALVLSHAQAALASGVSSAQVGRLARLAAALGASDATLAPYLSPPSQSP